MSELESQLKRVGEKLQLMLKQRDLLLKENVKMKQEIADLRTERKDHLNSVEKLRQQVEILKISRTEMNEAEKKQFEKRLSQYIREIDRCIGLLEQ
jgi:chromosome segregation ATPase